MKRCPKCAEEIQDAAIKCRFCGAAVITPGVASAAARWGRVTQAERDAVWRRLNEQERRELQEALHLQPKKSTVNQSLGVIVAIVGLLMALGALRTGNVFGLVIGAAVLALGAGLYRMPQKSSPAR